VEKLRWLGLFDASVPADQKDMTAATMLLQLLEAKLTPLGDEQDQAIMEHQLSYEFRDEHYEFRATLVSKGDNVRDGALAKAIGLTCGIAAKSFLLGSITVKGLHTPVIREIYDPILNELSDLGVAFHVEEKKLGEPEAVLK
jgi:saccharopine dehydrogenase (NADP+, L-glutamate forming)